MARKKGGKERTWRSRHESSGLNATFDVEGVVHATDCGTRAIDIDIVAERFLDGGLNGRKSVLFRGGRNDTSGREGLSWKSKSRQPSNLFI